MKKILSIALIAAAASAFAALDTASVVAINAFEPKTISSNATNEVVVAAGPLKGQSEVMVCADAAISRTALNATVSVTNTAAGGWAIVASSMTANTNAVILRVEFPGEYASGLLKVSVSSLGAASTANAVILTNR